MVGEKLQQDTYDVIRKHININNNELLVEEASWDKRFAQIINTLAYIVFVQGMRVDPNKSENAKIVQSLYNTAVYGDKERLKYNRDKYKNNLIQFMDTDVYQARGYGDHKAAKAASIEQIRDKAAKEYFLENDH